MLMATHDGLLIETCAGLLEQVYPEAALSVRPKKKLATKVDKVQKLFEAYMSPGSVTEIIHFFAAEYAEDMQVSAGGGLAHEQEDIRST